MIIIIIFESVGLANDLIGTVEILPNKVSIVRKFHDFLFTVIGFPITAFVASTFWVIWARILKEKYLIILCLKNKKF
jgi:hypothetical protein